MRVEFLVLFDDALVERVRHAAAHLDDDGLLHFGGDDFADLFRLADGFVYSLFFSHRFTLLPACRIPAHLRPAIPLRGDTSAAALCPCAFRESCAALRSGPATSGNGA